MEPSLTELRTTLDNTEAHNLTRAVVNSPFKYKSQMVSLGIGIIVLLIKNKRDNLIYRVSLSETELAAGTLEISYKQFREIKIPSDNEKNIIAQAIRDKQPHMTEDWQYLFTPALSPEQARLNQAGGGIACSFVYPLTFGDEAGAMIFSYYKEPLQIGKSERDFMKTYSGIVSERIASSGLSVGDLLR